METHQTVHGGIHLLIDAAALLLAGRDRVVDQTLVCGLVRCREDERRVRRRILGLVHVDSCTMGRESLVALALRNPMPSSPTGRTRYSHSKSPESDTTTVPVCLSASREVVMVAGGGVVVVVVAVSLRSVAGRRRPSLM